MSNDTTMYDVVLLDHGVIESTGATEDAVSLETVEANGHEEAWSKAKEKYMEDNAIEDTPLNREAIDVVENRSAENRPTRTNTSVECREDVEVLNVPGHDEINLAVDYYKTPYAHLDENQGNQTPQLLAYNVSDINRSIESDGPVTLDFPGERSPNEQQEESTGLTQ